MEDDRALVPSSPQARDAPQLAVVLIIESWQELFKNPIGHSRVRIQPHAVRSGCHAMKPEQGAVKLAVAKCFGKNQSDHGLEPALIAANCVRNRLPEGD
jgi:hypothetical protein